MLNPNILAIQMPGFDEWIVIAIIGVIVFGKKLPEVGRNLGKGIVEFKKGLKGIDEEVERQSNMQTAQVQSTTPILPQSTVVTSAPTAVIPPGSKFDPFTGKPLEQVTAGNDA
jgi:sec-independent protein translocase protein TatA